MTQNYAGLEILDEIICRRCTTASEEIDARRGFCDKISYEAAEEKEIICTRCNNQIPT